MASTTSNQGTGPAGLSSTRHYISSDNIITSADTAVPGTYSFGLAAGDSESQTMTITVPAYVPPGTYFFGACADDLLEVAESNETNNCRVATTTLAVNPACTDNTISPTSQSFSASGGPGSVSVTAPNGCSWTAVSNDSWITFPSGNNGSGNGTVNYSVAANPSTASRNGTLTIAGKTFTVTQGGQVSSSLTVLTPNGGETWTIGTTPTIQWTSSGVSGNVKIELSRDGGTSWTTLFSSTANDGTENWQVTSPGTTQARIRISSVTAPSIIDTSNANFTINIVGLRINDVSRAEGNTGTTAFTFTVTLTPASTGNVTVTYATANGSALAGSDYTTLPSTLLTFSPGQTSKLKRARNSASVFSRKNSLSRMGEGSIVFGSFFARRCGEM